MRESAAVQAYAGTAFDGGAIVDDAIAQGVLTRNPDGEVGLGIASFRSHLANLMLAGGGATRPTLERQPRDQLKASRVAVPDGRSRWAQAASGSTRTPASENAASMIESCASLASRHHAANAPPSSDIAIPMSPPPAPQGL